MTWAFFVAEAVGEVVALVVGVVAVVGGFAPPPTAGPVAGIVGEGVGTLLR